MANTEATVKVVWSEYRDKTSGEGAPADTEAGAQLIDACGNVMAREIDSWRAEWINDMAATKFLSELDWAERNRSRASGDC